jgi:hypothetical protein
MGTAKIMSMRSRPFQISHLCFDSDGILGELKAQLGTNAAAFDFPVFYATLASAPTVAGDPSRLLYDFLAIQAFTAPAALASLRAEQGKAALDKAINARQNAFFAKYGSISAIVSRGVTSYTAAGFLDLETGTFVQTGVNWNQVGLYSLDTAITGTTAAGVGVGIYVFGGD